jgi:hypothetical protein
MASDKHARADMEEGDTARKHVIQGPVLLREVLV